MSRTPLPIQAPDSVAATREFILRAGLALLIFVVTSVAFYPALMAGYCDFDDPGFLLLHNSWRGLSARNLAWMFTTPHLGHYQPLTFLSYAIEYELFHTSPTPVLGTNVDLNPMVPHATNIILHAINGVLVFCLSRQVLVIARAKPDEPTQWALLPSVLAALTWSLHPLRVESVAWITERRDVLSAAFLLGAALAYLRAFAKPTTHRATSLWWKISIALLLASLLSKAWGITFFVIALLLDIYPLRRLPWQPWKWTKHPEVLADKIPFAALGVIFAISAAYAQKVAAAGQTMKSLTEWGILARLAQSAYGLWFYLWKSVWPADHALLYELPGKFVAGERRWAIAALAVLVLGVAGVIASQRRRGLGVAIMAYCVLIAPVLGLAQSGIQLVAERYSYLALIPLGMAMAVGIAGAGHAPMQARWARVLSRVGCGVVLALCVVLAGLTWKQCYVWHETRQLWEQAIRSGAKGPIIHNFLARAMEKTEQYDDAMVEYQRSLDADPNYGDSLFGIGLLHYKAGRTLESEKYLLLAEKFTPDPMAAQLQLGLLYRRNPATQPEAIEAFTRAVATIEKSGNPLRTGEPYLNLASAYGESGNDKLAFELLQSAARFPDTQERALSLLRQMQGQ